MKGLGAESAVDYASANAVSQLEQADVVLHTVDGQVTTEIVGLVRRESGSLR